MDPIQYSGDTLYTEGKTFEFVLAAGGIVHRDAIESNNRLPAFQRNEARPEKKSFSRVYPSGRGWERWGPNLAGNRVPPRTTYSPRRSVECCNWRQKGPPMSTADIQPRHPFIFRGNVLRHVLFARFLSGEKVNVQTGQRYTVNLLFAIWRLLLFPTCPSFLLPGITSVYGRDYFDCLPMFLVVC